MTTTLPPNHHEAIIILCTCPDTDVASTIAHALLDRTLAACINAIPGVTSWFRWQGQVEQANEVQLVIKTLRARYQAVEQCIRDQHPYDVPEIIALPIHDGSHDYLDWIAQSVTSLDSPNHNEAQ